MFYQYLLVAHSVLRWIVLIFIVYMIIRASAALIRRNSFTATDNAFRHWGATAAHIQMAIGIIIYAKSALIKYYWDTPSAGDANPDAFFFSLLHPLLMLAAIVILTIGSALAKRKHSDQQKFQTILVWFVASLIIILIAIPWPFSPLSERPFLRTF